MKTLYLGEIVYKKELSCSTTQVRHQYSVKYALEELPSDDSSTRRLKIDNFYQISIEDVCYTTLSPDVREHRVKQDFIKHFKSLGYDDVKRYNLRGDILNIPIGFTTTARYGICRLGH